jgi:hypothetical protein
LGGIGLNKGVMDDKLAKPRPQGHEVPAPAAPAKPRKVRKPAGRVGFDDRGNAVWEWAPNIIEAQAPREEDRLRLLDNSSLELLDEKTAGQSGKGPVSSPISGYNPYDSSSPAGNSSSGAAKPKTGRKDLRKLGEWLALRTKMGLPKKP